MTPDQLNNITTLVMADLHESAVVPLAKAYKRLLRKNGRYMARKVRAHSHAVTAAILPPDEDEAIAPDLDKQVAKVTRKERDEMVKLLISAYEAHEVAFDVAPTITPALLEKIGEHATFAAEADLRDVYRGVIEQAFLEGYSIPRTANAIVEQVDAVADYRAVAMARTDLIGLANGASMGIATDAFAGREDVTKVWLATEDDRTRETHIDANGQEVGLNDFFDVGGYSAMYPGDPDLPDEEVINCRCTVIYSGGGGGEQEEEAQSTVTASVRPTAYSPGMPWHVVENHSECADGKPFAVVKDSDSSVAGCHPSRAAANRQMRALYANEEASVEAATAAVNITVEDDTVIGTVERTRDPWEGPLAIEGKATSDGRYLLPGEIGERDMPLPIAPSHEAQHETDTVGRIEFIERIPAAEFDKPGWEDFVADHLQNAPPQAVVIWGEGTFDGSPEAEDAKRQMENGVGISLDLPMERQAIIDSATFEEVDPATLDEEILFGLMFGMKVDGYLRGIGGKIGGASLASIAAFEETRIRLVGDHALVASGFAIRPREVVVTNMGGLGYALDSKPLKGIIRDSVMNDRFGWNSRDGIVASVQPPLAPPREWFFMEEPDEPTPITITPDGRVYGHLALWNTCHAGRANGAYSSCMFAPTSPSGYKQYHLGAILCDDGSEVAIGRVTIGTGHAPLHLNAAATRAHYDNTGTCVAFTRAKDGVFGIFVCGVVKSDATPEQVRDFYACPPSGDWRTVDGRLELQAALAVNTPAFTVARSQLALSASADVLEISALILGPPDDEDRAEALRAEFALIQAEDVDMLVDLGAAGDPLVQKLARAIAAK